MMSKMTAAQAAWDAAKERTRTLQLELHAAYREEEIVFLVVRRARPFSSAEMERIAAVVKDGGRIFTKDGDSDEWGEAWNDLRDREFLTDHETVYKDEHLGWRKRSVDYGAATLVAEAIAKWREEGGRE